MSTITMAKLSKRLGISRAAITQAARAEKIDMDGELVNLDGERTRAYLARFTLHRGKQKQPEPQSPAATEALARKLRAQYARSFAKLQQRKENFIPAGMFYASDRAMFDCLTREVVALPDKVNYGVPELELELIKAAEGAMQAGLDAAIAGSRTWKGSTSTAPSLVETLPDDMSIGDLRAGLDLLAAYRHTFEHAVEAGAALHKDTAMEMVGKIDGTVFATLRHLPRRFVAEVAAVRETQGQEAARARLKELIESDILPVIKQGANREKNRTE